MASRPTTPLRRRVGARLPSIRRLLAGTGAVAVVAVIVALLNGPWMRVGDVAWEGDAFTPDSDVAAILDGARGESLLAIDTGALQRRIESLSSVASASVAVSLFGSVTATITEPEPAFVWETAVWRYVGAADGALVARERTNRAIGAALADLPLITDRRPSGRVLAVGDVIPEALVRATIRLAAVDPAVMGSDAPRFAIRIDNEVGIRLIAEDPGWEIALGAYGADPGESVADAEARLDRQLTAIRTLFATRDEAELGWVDARNPGKVYFRAKG
jgi:cell division septal protein FtsQ